MYYNTYSKQRYRIVDLFYSFSKTMLTLEDYETKFKFNIKLDVFRKYYKQITPIDMDESVAYAELTKKKFAVNKVAAYNMYLLDPTNTQLEFYLFCEEIVK